ncbi:tRNA (adenosine(37)-N6)-threonylcarbamoyltransferase complex dimerization subunit type 1 TsaB [Chitinophaga sp. sic0106]|uniref:tRNA (adenosine(37)-N6)-threonylcarbamoyltransferase complex dimerization subunit type 1 TsaB n=1 Tax=Chitinophaga sp. sic0106 TaxID=2854785 RepID=UPI001C480526|nr:tRNA (adenosine(37)-N6)-threonylcarbamoyltransferase complex dimerization subunit type 1 TsaB [Chitinophaga sp. sic0106]MBV7528888.1 tRNA (adenosine(37)-N6)-threonylcarbamoyltransferase complex dimerization subunit type 1 TsaB [Chitinophaga sp. sic0106]
MALIINIDTATVRGSVSLARDGKVIQTLASEEQRDHAATMVLFIQQLLQEQGVSPAAVDAIAVSAGPGSYTGLRVGVATAKGLCYAWEKPLIAVSTLQMMAEGMVLQQRDANALYCPMLDARRMEVFTGVYTSRLVEVLPPQALILDENSYKDLLAQHKVIFFGDGSPKWRQLLNSQDNAAFAEYEMNAGDMSLLSEAAYAAKSFADLAYFSPFYLKPFFFPKKA